MEDHTGVAFAAFITGIVLFLLGVLGLMAYEIHMRAKVIAGSSDPIAAACAYDGPAGRDGVPSTCLTYLFRNQEFSR